MHQQHFLQNAWIYIAIDAHNFSRSKIGITTRATPLERIREGSTSNPYYLPFTAYNLSSFKITLPTLKEFEKYAQSEIGRPVHSAYSGYLMEWRTETPPLAESVLEHCIIKFFSPYGFDLSNEDGLLNQAVSNTIKVTYRPHPLELMNNLSLDQNMCGPYLDFLNNYYNSPQ